LRLFNEYFHKLLAAAGCRWGLGALLFAAMLVGSATPAGAAESYKAGEGAAECSNYASIEERSWIRRIGIARFIQQELDRKYNDSLGRFEYNLKSALLNDYAATREDMVKLTSLRYFRRSFYDRIAAKEYSIYVFGNGSYEIWIYIERIGCIYSIDNSYVLSKSTL
jgi:hypothetical protein